MCPVAVLVQNLLAWDKGPGGDLPPTEIRMIEIKSGIKDCYTHSAPAELGVCGFRRQETSGRLRRIFECFCQRHPNWCSTLTGAGRLLIKVIYGISITMKISQKIGCYAICKRKEDRLRLNSCNRGVCCRNSGSDARLLIRVNVCYGDTKT